MLLQEDIISVLNKVLKQKGRIRRGEDLVYFCPACNHYKRKLEVNIFTGKYHCWVCGFSGLSFKTLFKKLNAPPEAYYIIKESYKLKPKDENEIDHLFDTKEKERNVVNFLPKEFKPIYLPQKSIEYKHAINYLKKRGVTKFDMYRYNIGYCEIGKFANRIIIPSYDSNNNLNFYSGRSYYDSCNFKYQNCDFSKDIVGFESNINWKEPITLTEGALDAIAIRYNAIPLFGKSMSGKLKKCIIDNAVYKINVILDDDAIKDSINIYDQLSSMGVKKIHIIVLKDKDPSKMGFEKITEVIDNSEAQTLSDMLKLKIKYS
jgi:transcription elongation factor Elf1